MNIEEIREYCLSKPHVTEDFPFDDVTLVFRIGGKIFAFLPTDAIPHSVALKCDPERALALRERYAGVRGAWHLDKRHWNSVEPESGIPAEALKEWIDHSYDLVLASLTRKVREALGVRGA